MTRSPPLRFLAIVLGGWVAARTALIAPPWPAPPADAAAAAPRLRSFARAAVRREGPRPATGHRSSPASPLPLAAALRARPDSTAARPLPAAGRQAPAPDVAAAPVPPPPPSVVARPVPTPGSGSPDRWSLSAWAFVRRGGSAPLAAGGLLGGSQAGARLAYRLNRDRTRPLALSARFSAPLRRPAGAEAALGLDWRPAAKLPIHLLAERQQALGREGRSAFALTVYGGVSEAPVGRFRLDAYAQVGAVGARSPDPFGDGSARLSLPLGQGLRVGAGAWAAAQPGLSRLDLGPQASLRLPAAGRFVTLAADWRLRAAGNAGPRSGPSLTLSTDF